jgi:hypothetical protein
MLKKLILTQEEIASVTSWNLDEYIFQKLKDNGFVFNRPISKHQDNLRGEVIYEQEEDFGTLAGGGRA